jgi:hypothetical protein
MKSLMNNLRPTVYLFSFLFLSFLLSACKKDSLSPEQSEFFLKFFGTTANDRGFDVKQTSDGGYILFGTTQITASNTDMFLIKTDKYGNTEWEKNYGDTSLDEGNSIRITADGNFVLLGTLSVHTSFGLTKQMYLVKVSSSGGLIWEKKFGHDESDESGNCLQITNDGKYVLVGYSTQQIDSIDPLNPGNLLGVKNLYIVKSDENQNFVERNYGYKYEDEANHVEIVPGTGDILVLGRTQFSGTDYNFLFLELQSDINATPLNSPNYGGAFDQLGESLVVLADGNRIMAGTSNNDVYVAKVANDLQNKVWEKTFGDVGPDLGKDVKQTDDNGFVVVGSKYNGANSDIYLIKLDENGNMVWEYTYGGSGDEMGETVEQTEDGGYIIIGSSGPLENQTICLLKVTAEGKLSK